MNLKEQLDELRYRLLRDTSNIIAGYKKDFLYSDDQLLRYIREAEYKFARETHILQDSVSPLLTQVILKTGVSVYELNCAVFEVVSARYDTCITDLTRTGHFELYNRSTGEDTFDLYTVSNQTQDTGAPMAFSTDEGSVGKNFGASVNLKVYPTPSATEDGNKVYLRVCRLPMRSYGIDKMESSACEFPLDYQLDVLSWAAFRALEGLDADKGAPIPAEKHRLNFEAAVADAKKKLHRQMHAPMRIGYGGAGLSWR